MRVWLYARLSRDDDDEMNSLNNQRKIVREFAKQQGFEVIGESFDDNVSGMTFDRDGIREIEKQVEDKAIDAVLVKDMSRLGRHKTDTAVFIDYLRRNEIRVISATENLDTSRQSDDLVISFKGLMNDYYAREGCEKVRIGMDYLLKTRADHHAADWLFQGQKHKRNRCHRGTGGDRSPNLRPLSCGLWLLCHSPHSK